MIRIEVTDPSEDEARALVAMFRAQFPAIADATPRVTNVTNVSAAAPAPDGFPASPEEIAAATPSEAPATPSEAPATPSAVERDADGIPWDERIHTSNKSTKQDGTWKRKPGVDDAVFNGVLAELRAANTARTVEAAASLTAAETDTSAADAFGAKAPPPPAPAEATPPPPPAPAAAAPPPPPPAPAAAASGVPSFVQIMQKITAAQQAGKLDKAALDAALTGCGLQHVGQLASADEGTRAAFDALLPA
jgi:hypothetical protein